MRWWCAAVDAPWSWVPRPYIGVWILCGALLALYFRSRAVYRRDHPDAPADPKDRRRAVWFVLGTGFLWVASDWPLGALGAGYLSAVHMLQYMLYTLGAAPLLLMGMPEWMLRNLLRHTRLDTAYRLVANPVVAALLFNLVLIATHAPVSVDALRSTQVGSFALDMVWLLSGIILWTPVVSPLPERQARSAPAKLVYLFLAAAVVPMIPGGFIAFSPEPLYGTYELAPRIGPSALEDQQMAGVIMKVGNLPVIWTVMAVIWFRWYERDQADVRRRRDARRVAAARASGERLSTRATRGTATADGPAGAGPAGADPAGTATITAPGASAPVATAVPSGPDLN